MKSANSNFTVFTARLGALPAKLYAGLRQALTRELEHIVSTSQRKYLSGPRPRVLGTVSARLRNSVTQKVTQTSTEIVGRIGTNVPYARRHEFGFRGIENVRAHTRVIGFEVGGKRTSQAQLNRLRKAVNDPDTKRRVGFRRNLKTIAGDLSGGAAVVQYVKAHRRTINYAGRPFLKPAIRDNAKAVQAGILRALGNLKNQI